MEKMNFSIGCTPQAVGQRAKRDTYFEHTPIALQLVLVYISWSVPFPKSGQSRYFNKKKFAHYYNFTLT